MSKPNLNFPLTLKQCRVIREIMKKGTEKEASSSLNLSQSSVSRSLSQAEQALQVDIFTRGWSGAEPTSAGEVVISSCNSILQAISDTECQLQSNVTALLKLKTYVEWRHLLIVEAVVKVGSASVAAQTLGMTQPAVSKTLKEIENMVTAATILKSASWFDPASCRQTTGFVIPKNFTCGSIATTQSSITAKRVNRQIVRRMLSFSCQDIVPIAFALYLSNIQGFVCKPCKALITCWQMLYDKVK